jgi:DNA-3-methyladenine glycosylase II
MMRSTLHIKPPSRVIQNENIAVGIANLIAVSPGLAKAHALVGNPPLRRWPPGFEGLVRIVTGQQLSIASANAIHARLQATVSPLTPQNLLLTDPVALKLTGLSAGKIATLRAVATAILDGTLVLEHLADAPAQEVANRLTAIRGIGPWTADIYLMFCRGDSDAFAAGDLALQIATQQLLSLEVRP